MLYHLVKYFSQHFDIPGVGMFLSLSFRAAMAIILALTIGMIFGRKIIRLLQRRQIGEEVRNLGLEGQLQKRGTPTMGGLIILLSYSSAATPCDMLFPFPIIVRVFF